MRARLLYAEVYHSLLRAVIDILPSTMCGFLRHLACVLVGGGGREAVRPLAVRPLIEEELCKKTSFK